MYVDACNEKDKSVRYMQLKLREFMQKNVQMLPGKAFDQIEDIITQSTVVGYDSSKAANSVVYSQKVPGQHRKMSQVYQNIQRIENAESKNDNYLNDIKKSLETIRERQRK